MYKESEQSLLLLAQSNLENAIVNESLDEALSSISQIREEPYKFIKNKNDIIVDLAIKRSEIFRWMKVLGLDKIMESEVEMTTVNNDDDDVSSLASSSFTDNPLQKNTNGHITPTKNTTKSTATTATTIDNDKAVKSIPADPLLDPNETDIRNTPIKSNGNNTSNTSSIATNLALKWANHLKNVDPTQGTFQPVTDNKSLVVTPIKTTTTTTKSLVTNTPISINKVIRPKWPDFLVDVTYDIYRINKMGMKSKITLKLTEYHLVYIKDGTQVTKIVSYKQIFEVSLTGGNVFIVNMYGNKVLTFYSQLASHIIQQIVTRVKVRLSLDKTSLVNDVQSSNGLSYSIAATETLINKITDENTTGASDTMSSFAAVLGEAYITRMTEVKSNSFIRRVSDSTVRRFSLSKKTKEIQTEYNLFIYKEGTAEYNLRTFLQKVIFDKESDEGSTLNDFIETFKEKGRTFNDVRHFIDGLHTFLMEKRGNQLASSLTSDADEELSELSKIQISTISFIVFITIEEAVYMPLKEILTNMLLEENKRSIDISPKENLIIRNMKLLAKRSQENSNIPAELISPLGWQSAIYELSSLENNLTPSLQLNALTRCAKAIYSEYKHVILPNIPALDKSKSHLGADEFLPIFMYVFCKSSLQRPSIHYQLMWKLCHPDQLHGECGYYLTVYESSVDFVSKEIQRKSLLNSLFTFS